MIQNSNLESERASGRSPVANIDVLRALAILGVFCNHVLAVTGFNIPILGRFGGTFGVQLFFLISGYLITESAIKHSAREYILHRFFRIFPPYWLVYFGFLALQGSYIDKQIVWFSVLLNFLNLQQLSPSALIRYDVIHVSWTLTIELFWYALAPLIVLGGKRLALPALMVFGVISALWSVLAANGSIDWVFADGFAALPSPPEYGQIHIVKNAAFPAQLVFFVMGANAYYYRDQILKWNSTLLNLLIVGLLLFVELYVPRLPDPTVLTGIGLFALFVTVIRAAPSRDWLLIRIGKVSYSFYLIHFSVILWVNHKFPTYPKPLIMLIAFILIFLLSNLLFEFIEKPFMRLGRHLSRMQSSKIATSKAELPTSTL